MRWPWSRRSRRRIAAPPKHAAWAQAAMPPPESSVTLGFTDGSEVELGDSDPAAMALHAVADVLLRRDQVEANSR